jgi:C-terminal processing protease CtpA/Prc
MDEVIKNPSLVLDLRGNRGENLEAALAALNFLIPDGRSVAYFATRRGLERLGLSSIDQLTSSSLPGAYVDDQAAVNKFPGVGMYLAGGKYKRPYRGRVALLIDEGCGGSCELFAAAMKEAGAATLIGRRTRGALFSTAPVTFNLFKMNFIKMNFVNKGIKGWTMELPVTDIRTASGLKIEGQGVAPDVELEGDASDKAILDRALSLLKGSNVNQSQPQRQTKR